MIQKVKIIFGKEQVIKLYNEEPLSNDELQNNLREYTFNSIEEKNSFLKGIDEAIGWTEYCIPELELREG